MNNRRFTRREHPRAALDATVLGATALAVSGRMIPAFALPPPQAGKAPIPFLDPQPVKPDRAMLHWAKLDSWMTQISRNLTNATDGFLVGKCYLIHDRDPLLTLEFRETLAAAGVSVVRLPARSPNLNAHADRFVRSIKETCLDRMVLFGERSLRRAAQEFVAHYHFERNCQGLDNKLIFPDRTNSKRSARVECRQ